MNPTVSVSSTCALSPRSTSRVSGSSVANSRSSTKTSGAPDERAQDRRLARVRVADERRLELRLPRLALNRATALHVAQPLAQNLDAVIDQPAVRLELRFAGAAHADAAAEFLEVGPHARQPRQHVLELRELHLHLRFARARARGEDVEDQLGAVHHALADRVLDVLALRRRQLVVEDARATPSVSLDAVAQLLDLALAEVGAGMRAVDLLRELAHDGRAGGVGELRELSQMVVDETPRARPLERGAHEERPFCRRSDDDRISAYGIILFRFLLSRDARRREAPVLEYGTVKLPTGEPTVTSPIT